MQEQAGAALTPTAPRTEDTPAPSRAGVLRWYALAAVVTLVLDQASKAWALGVLDGGRQVPLIGEVLSLRVIRNSGAAFSIGDSMTWVMTLVALAVTAAILAAARRLGSARWALALGLLLGGSLGNLADRFFREPGPLRGHVVDFIDYAGWFVGNVADIAIVGGAALLIWLVFANVELDGTPPEHAAETRGADPAVPAAEEENPDG